MIFKALVTFVAAALMVAYIAPVVLRLRDETALWVVCVATIVMMLIDLWQSLKAKED